MRKILSAFSFAAVAAFAAPAFADDYVFNVPVRIENAEMISTAVVRCMIEYRGGFTDHGSTIIPITGAYRGTVEIRITPPPERRAADTIRWRCYLDLLLGPPGEGAVWLNGSMSEEGKRIRYTAASGRSVASSRTVSEDLFRH